MSFNEILNLIFTFFAVLGGIDYLLDNRFGLGKEFERGIHCSGPLILCMVGFMTFAEWFGSLLSPLFGPLLIKIGADPSLVAGCLLSVDSGGAVLAEQMALTKDAAILNGYFVASMAGSALNGHIPLSVLAIQASRRREVLLGLAMGIAAIPFGCLISGLLAGLELSVMIGNLLPLAILSAILVLSMLFAGDTLVKILKIFGKLTTLICVAGVLIAALGELCGIEVLPCRMAFSEIMTTIGRIVLTLIGMFPLMGILTRLLETPLKKIAVRLNASLLDVKCLLVDSVNCFSTIDQLNDLTDLGILMNCAFGICGGYALGDHYAYVSVTAPELSLPMVAGKLGGGVLSLVLAYLMYQRLWGKRDKQKAVCTDNNKLQK